MNIHKLLPNSAFKKYRWLTYCIVVFIFVLYSWNFAPHIQEENVFNHGFKLRFEQNFRAIQVSECIELNEVTFKEIP